MYIGLYTLGKSNNVERRKQVVIINMYYKNEVVLEGRGLDISL